MESLRREEACESEEDAFASAGYAEHFVAFDEVALVDKRWIGPLT